MKKIIALLLALVMVLGLAACGGSDNGSADNGSADAGSVAETQGASAAVADIAAVQAAGKLVVGITDFAPMDYQDENGEWIGFDADMARGFAERLGVDVEFLEIEWDNKILELNNGTIDCVWNGMTLTDEVTASMDCSNAYSYNSQCVVVKSAGAADMVDQDAVVNSGLNFAVESGSAGEQVAIDLGLNYTSVTSQAQALMEVSAGTCDGCIIDNLMASAMVGEGTSYADLVATVDLNREEYGVGFRQGSDLVAELNDYFAEAYADGTMDQIAETYNIGGSVIPQQ